MKHENCIVGVSYFVVCLVKTPAKYLRNAKNYKCIAVLGWLHLSQNSMKCSQNAKNKKSIAVYFASLFRISHHFLRFASIRTKGGILAKCQPIYSLFFHGINETQNLNEIQKVYGECFVFRCMFCENTRKIPAKCEIR